MTAYSVRTRSKVRVEPNTYQILFGSNVQIRSKFIHGRLDGFATIVYYLWSPTNLSGIYDENGFKPPNRKYIGCGRQVWKSTPIKIRTVVTSDNSIQTSESGTYEILATGKTEVRTIYVPKGSDESGYMHVVSIGFVDNTPPDPETKYLWKMTRFAKGKTSCPQ